MDSNKEWKDMTWREKREERFNVWLNPKDVKAIKLEEPDRVPVMLPTGNSPAYWAGSNFHALMYDYDKAFEIWKKYMEEFGDMDIFSGPMIIPSGKISEVVTSKLQKLPGLCLPDDAPMNQYVEGEYMKPDEYDLLMMDPTDYNLRILMPRTSDFFKSFAKLPLLRLSYGNPWVAAMTDPDIRQTFQTLIDLSEEYIRWQTSSIKTNDYIRSHGYPSLFGGGVYATAPFDYFADTLRGTHGIVMDMYRQPEKLHEAMEWFLKLTIETSIKNSPITTSPICLMPLHKGDDVFMSDAQFEEFYWPGLRAVFMAMIEEGLVPMPFAEGRFTNRLKQIADTPKSGVVWWFDQTDMVQAKKILGDVSCIVGNVPTSVVMTGTVEQVKETCHKLIENCAPGGGYILGGGAVVDNGKIENLQAMMKAAKEYGVY
ncbi:MAG: uroporphyrinogen decarboxylase family protein [Dehalococcoidia bacterium]|jgi:hypothetical protein